MKKIFEDLREFYAKYGEIEEFEIEFVSEEEIVVEIPELNCVDHFQIEYDRIVDFLFSE